MTSSQSDQEDDPFWRARIRRHRQKSGVRWQAISSPTDRSGCPSGRFNFIVTCEIGSQHPIPHNVDKRIVIIVLWLAWIKAEVVRQGGQVFDPGPNSRSVRSYIAVPVNRWLSLDRRGFVRQRLRRHAFSSNMGDSGKTRRPVHRLAVPATPSSDKRLGALSRCDLPCHGTTFYLYYCAGRLGSPERGPRTRPMRGASVRETSSFAIMRLAGEPRQPVERSQPRPHRGSRVRR